jgi:hypothetical protein
MIALKTVRLTSILFEIDVRPAEKVEHVRLFRRHECHRGRPGSLAGDFQFLG